MDPPHHLSACLIFHCSLQCQSKVSQIETKCLQAAPEDQHNKKKAYKQTHTFNHSSLNTTNQPKQQKQTLFN